MKRYRLILIALLFLSNILNSSAQSLIDITKYLPLSHDESGQTDYTKILQSVFNKHDKILMPNFPIMITDVGLRLRSNMKIVFQPNSKLILRPTNKGTYDMIKIIDSKNIEIVGANLEGNKDRQLSQEGEWGMGITIRGGSDIKITSARISGTWGDGIYIAKSKNNLSKNIVIEKSSFTRNGRNGITVISALGVQIRDCSFTDINDKKPMAGIDIEPNNKSDIVTDVYISNINSNNNGQALQVGLSRYPESNRNINILVKNLKSINDDYGMIIGGFYNSYKSPAQLTGTINISDVSIVGAKKRPISLARYYNYGPKYFFKKIRIGEKKDRKTELSKFKQYAEDRGIIVK